MEGGHNVSEGGSDPRTPHGDDESHDESRVVVHHQREDTERWVRKKA